MGLKEIEKQEESSKESEHQSVESQSDESEPEYSLIKVTKMNRWERCSNCDKRIETQGDKALLKVTSLDEEEYFCSKCANQKT